MGFKTIDQYNSDKYKDFFILANDGDFADVVFLYRNTQDVLVADAHYIKTDNYSGYVHCCGTGCPCCSRHFKVQPKIFIPLYNIAKNKIEFWDRSARFESKLSADVFRNYPEPSNYVFRITRHGVAGDPETTYEIRAVGKNSSLPYEKILADNNAVMPDYYGKAIKDLSSSEIESMLASTGSGSEPTSEYNYIPSPRATGTSAPEPVTVPTPNYSEPVPSLPDEVPAADDDDLSDIKF